MCVLFSCWTRFNAFYCQLPPRSLKINYHVNTWILLVHCFTLICATALSKGLPDVCSAWFFVTSAACFSHSWFVTGARFIGLPELPTVAWVCWEYCPAAVVLVWGLFLFMDLLKPAWSMWLGMKCVLSSAGMGDLCEKVLAVLVSLLCDASCVGKSFTVVFRIAWKSCCQNCQKIGSVFYLTIKANNKIFIQVNKFKKAFLKLLCFEKQAGVIE